VGSDTELREFFADASVLVGGMPVRVRVGDQSLNWGESAFLRFGVPVSNPLDFVAALRPESAARDVQLPQGMIWVAANPTEVLAVEGYYQYDWDPAHVARGRYWTTTCRLGASARGMLGRPSDLNGPRFRVRFPARNVDSTRIMRATAASRATWPVRRHRAGHPSRAELTASRSTTRPQPAADRAHQRPRARRPRPPRSRARCGARADYEAVARHPRQRRSGGRGSTLTIGEYASQASYFAEYPEDIRMLGFSFNTRRCARARSSPARSPTTSTCRSRSWRAT
jgi:hypothetical protein